MYWLLYGHDSKSANFSIFIQIVKYYSSIKSAACFKIHFKCFDKGAVCITLKLRDNG